MKSWTLLLLSFALANGSAGFAAVPPSVHEPKLSCDDEVKSVNSSLLKQNTPDSAQSRSNVDYFMGLVAQGLAKKDLKAPDLEWLSEQRSPSQPKWSGKSVENLALRNGFSRVVSKLNRKEWSRIKTRLKAGLQLLNKEKTKVENAKEETRNVFSSIPTQYKLQGSSFLVQHFVAKNGDIYACTTGNSDSWVYSLKNGTVTKLEWFEAHTSWIDFFETSQGQVVFAYMAHSENVDSADLIQSPLTQLRVIDAQTGDEIARHEFPSTGAPPFQPFIYEKDGSLKVALGYYSAPPPDKNGSADLYVYDVQSKKYSVSKILSGTSLRFERLESGKIYASGMHSPSGPHANFGYTNVFLYDVIEGHYDINSYTNKINPNNIFPTLLEEATLPTLAFYNASAADSDWKFANVRTGRIEAMNSTKRLGSSTISTLIDNAVWVFDYSEVKGTNSWNLELNPLRPHSSLKPMRATVHFKVPRVHPSHFNLNGQDVFLVRDVHGESEVFHFFDRQLKKIGNIPFQKKIESDSDPFVDPMNGRIYMFVHQDFDEPWVLYQLYGPEDAR